MEIKFNEYAMANMEHIDIIKQGVDYWNKWREDNSHIIPDLSRAVLTGLNLSNINFKKAYLPWANLSKTNLSYANLSRAVLNGTNISNSNLSYAKFSDADLTATNLSYSDLKFAEFVGATFIETDLTNADLSNSLIYGISVWDVKLNKTIQNDLIITPDRKNKITVDNLKIAQFIYLLLRNEEIRDAIETIGKKTVLIIGRFTEKRKRILDTIKENLRTKNYLPILFDFEAPQNKDITETVSILAHIAKYIIADITDAKSIPQELQIIVPNLPSVAVQPIIEMGKREYGMIEHFKKYPWVLPIYRYKNIDDLVSNLEEKIISPAEAKVIEIRS